MSANEYRWKWMKPDRPGVWAFGGVNRTNARFFSAMHIKDYAVSATGWWCFLMDLPEILPPKKKTVWRLWMEPYIPADPFPSCYRPLWYPDGVQPEMLDAIRTDKTMEPEV